jgi:hypothetical protein
MGRPSKYPEEFRREALGLVKGSGRPHPGEVTLAHRDVTICPLKPEAKRGCSAGGTVRSDPAVWGHPSLSFWGRADLVDLCGPCSWHIAPVPGIRYCPDETTLGSRGAHWRGAASGPSRIWSGG